MASPLIEHIGRAKKLWFANCSPSPQVWMETFYPALGVTLWGTLPGSWKQGYKVVAGHSWLCGVKGKFEDLTQDDPTWADNDAINFLFEVTEWADKAVWFMFLADLGPQFFINWSTLARKFTMCRGTVPDGPCMTNPPSDEYWTPFESWAFQFPGTVIQDPGNWTQSQGFSVPKPGPIRVGYSQPFFSLSGSHIMQGRVHNMTSGETFGYSNFLSGDDPLAAIQWGDDLPQGSGNDFYRVEFQNLGSGYAGTTSQGRFTVQRGYGANSTPAM